MSDLIRQRGNGPWYDRVAGDMSQAFAAERERWLLWLPVGLGAGIAVYFALPVEPSLWRGGLLAVGLLALAVISRDRIRFSLPPSCLEPPPWAWPSPLGAASPSRRRS